MDKTTTTFVAGLNITGLIAPLVLDGPISRDAFETYVARVLVPELAHGDVVIMITSPATRGGARGR